MGDVIAFAPRAAMAREPWLSKRQAAEHLGVTTRTIERWQRDAGLPVHHAGTRCRYRATELDRWLRSG